jgi:hypothetical protein
MPAINQNTLLLRLLKDVSDIRASLRRVTVNLPLFDIASENTPAQLTNSQDNYVIGNYDILRLSGSVGNISITGLRGGIKGRSLRIFNIGSFIFRLPHENAASDITNRFHFSNGLDVIIPPGSNVILYYDFTQGRWIGGDALTSGAVWSGTSNNIAQAAGVSPMKTQIDPGTIISDQYSQYLDAFNLYQIRIPGFYRTSFWATWAGAAFTGRREIYIRRNIADVANNIILSDGAAVGHEVSYEDYFVQGTTFSFYASFSGGAALNLASVRTSISKIG